MLRFCTTPVEIKTRGLAAAATERMQCHEGSVERALALAPALVHQ